MKSSKFFLSTLVAAAAMTAPAWAGTTVGETTYSGSIYTWANTASVQKDLAYGGWKLSTYENEDYTYGDEITTWNPTIWNLFASSETGTGDFHTIRFDSSVGSNGSMKYTFGPVTIAGIIVETGTTGYSIIAPSTSYNRSIYIGNNNETVAYSTINEDFSIDNSASSHADNAINIRGTQTWTIADGKTFSLTSDKINISGSLTVNGGTIAVSSATVVFDGLNLASTTFVAETAGLQNVRETYTLYSGTGTISGLTAENVTVNGEAVTSVTGSTATRDLSVYNILVGSEASYDDEGVSTADRINVAGTLDMGTASSEGASNPATLSAENIIGTGTIKWGNTGEKHYVKLNLSDGFTGTLQLSGQLRGDTWGDLKNVGTVNLDGAWLYTGAEAKIDKAVVITDTVRSGTDDEAGVNLYIAGSVTFSNSFDASGKIVKVASGTTTFSGETTIGDLNISGGTVILGVDDYSGDTPNSTATLSATGKSLSGSLTIKGGAKVTVATGNDALNYDGTNTITVANGGELYFDTARWTVGSSNKIVLSGGKITGTGEASYGAVDFYGNNTLASTGGLESTVEAPIRLRGNLTVSVGDDSDADSSLVVSGAISQHDGKRALEKTGKGALTLSGNNTYAGGTTISAGTLVAANANALGTGAVKIVSGANLQADTAVTLSSNLTLVVSEADKGGVGLISGAGVTLADSVKLLIDIQNLTSLSSGDANEVALNIAAAGALTVNQEQIQLGAWIDDTWQDYSGHWDIQAWNGDTGVLTLAIPEPSLFGFLAGLGALTLVGTRRRRGKKA